jgi:hypothetical protein
MKGEILCQTTLPPSLLNSVGDNPLPVFSILSVLRSVENRAVYDL